MIWWRGSGLLLAALVLFVVAATGHLLGPAGVSIGCLAAAGMIFMIKGHVAEETSLYSIPVGYWPPLLAVLGVVAFFNR